VPLTKTRPIPVSLSDLLLLLILTLLAVKVAVPIILLVAGADASPLLLSVVAIVVQSGILFTLIATMVVGRRGVAWPELGFVPLPRGWFSKSLLAALLALPLVGLVNLAVQATLGEPLKNPQLEALAPQGFSWFGLLSMLVLVGAVVPLVEEIAFRGLLYGWLRDRFQPLPAIAINAVLFAVMHGIPALIPALIVVGALLAFVYEKSGSIWAAILVHGAFNSAMTVGLYFALSQGAAL